MQFFLYRANFASDKSLPAATIFSFLFQNSEVITVIEKCFFLVNDS